MKILHDSAFDKLPETATIFLDTNEFVTALKSPDFSRLVIGRLKNNGYSLVTSPETFWEFVRGSDNIENFNKRKTFIESIVDNFPAISKRMESSVILYVLALHKACPNMDHADLLLGVSLCIFPESYLLTQNHHHFSLSVFERIGIITMDNDSKIHNHCLYKIDRIKLAGIIKSLTKK